MSTAEKFFRNLFFITLVLLACSPSVVAQTSHGKRTDDDKSGKHSFESRFWNYLVANNYKNWAPPAGRDGGFFAGSGPHGAFLKLYLNRTAITSPGSFDNESVVVMEEYRADKTLESISVMLKSENSNPEANDWFWVVYRPDGSVIESSSERDATTMDRKEDKMNGEDESPFKRVSTTQVLAESHTCVRCHRAAPGEDFVFFNQTDEHRVAKESRSADLDDGLSMDATR